MSAFAQRGETLRPIAIGESQLERFIRDGYGALLYEYALKAPELLPGAKAALMRLVLAMLAAKAADKRRRTALAAILDTCSSSLNRLTLLKGMSLCDMFYPRTYWRPMGDIDLLVAPEDLFLAERALRVMGYTPASRLTAEFYENHHHSMPLRDPNSGVKVEIHTALFPPYGQLTKSRAFHPSNIQAELRLSDFQGRAVHRLSLELQVVYLASHAVAERRIFASLFPFLDITFLLQRAGSQLNWDKVLSWLDDRTVSAYVCVLLTYLDRRHIVELPPTVRAALEAIEKRFGRLALKVIHGAIDRYAVGGQSMADVLGPHNRAIIWDALLCPRSRWLNLISIPWNLAFPPSNSERFKLEFQRERLRSALSRLRK